MSYYRGHVNSTRRLRDVIPYRHEINKDLNAHPSSINNNRQYKNLNFYLVALNLQSICINAHRSCKHWDIEHFVIVFFCGILYIDKADTHR